MTAAEIAKNLQGKKSGAGWVARRPAHEDHNPSLSLRDKDGRVLVHCHAGCDQRAVLKSLEARGLWPERDLEPEEWRQRPHRTISATYDYTDKHGCLLYQVVRYQPK